MDIYQQPYTYLIGWSRLNKYYYGVRYSKKCNPADLWVTYFTSSKFVQRLREKEGEPDIKEIRKVFDNTTSAILWEEKVLRRLGVLQKENWLNRNIAGAIHPHRHGAKNKGKKRSKETIVKAVETKKKNGKPNLRKGMKMPQISAANKGRPNPNKGKKFGPMSEEAKAKMAAARKRYYANGGKGPNSGKIMSSEVKSKISANSIGKTKPRKLGIKPSDETRKKMSDSRKRYNANKSNNLELF